MSDLGGKQGMETTIVVVRMMIVAVNDDGQQRVGLVCDPSLLI